MIVDGKKLADEILAELKREVLKLDKKIRLAIVRVGENSVSQKFIERKKQAADKIGVDVREYAFAETISTNELRKKIAEIARAKPNTGVIIQLPLPESINTQYILNGVTPQKDVDALSARSLGDFLVGKSAVLPPVVGAVKEIFERHKIDISGKNIVVVGRGKLVGKPLAVWLLNQGATFSVLNSKTPDLKEHTLTADILISGIGKPKFITADMVKKDAVVIDCGTSVVIQPEAGGRKSGTALAGDVDFDSVAKKASLITPVPGGVGPLTVAMLFKNLFILAS